MDELKKVFDDIRAEDGLKTATAEFLETEMNRRGLKQNRTVFRRFSVAFASAAVLLFSGMFAYRIYFTPVTYIDVDVNPSIEMILNRFDRVIDTYAYNADGEVILDKADIRHKNYSEAIGILFDVIAQNGYVLDDSLISVTLQSEGRGKENIMLSDIESTVRQHHGTAQIECFTIGGHVRDAAHCLNLSPAKYLAIQDLLNVDPTATVDGCRNHTIGELKELTEHHSDGHHDAVSEGMADPGAQKAEESEGGHHAGGNHGGSHHGEGHR